MSQRKTAIGVDMGGTQIRVGLVDAGGQVIGVPEAIPTLAQEQGAAIIERLVCSIRKVMRQAIGTDLAGIGIGCTGPLDLTNGIILECNSLPTLHGYPLKKSMEEEFGLPVSMDNDANALILGEALWGAGRGIGSILGLTLGTGLGAALVRNGRIEHGATGCAGEIWLSPYKDGIIEDYVSGTGIANIYRRITGKQLAGEQIAELARCGHEDALQTFDEFAGALAYALAWAVNLVDPQMVILGGSVMQSADLFLKKTENELIGKICSSTAKKIRLTEAGLRANSGFIGAAALILTDE